MFEILFAGTGASIPSRSRSLPCIAIKQGRSLTLFDCGEGSQRQLMVSRFSFMRVDRIFITHMHGDHVLGLPGLLLTMGLSGRREPVQLFGPKGISLTINSMLDACEGELEFELIVHEMEPGDVERFNGFSVSAFRTEHNCPSLGYLYKEDDRSGSFDKEKAMRFGLKPGPDFSAIQRGEEVRGISPEMIIGEKRPGLSLAYPGDTLICDSVSEAIRGVDVLIHEGTYLEKDSELAVAHFHSTIKDVAKMAKEAGVRQLMIVHVSHRYGEESGPSIEASTYFEGSIIPKDQDIYMVCDGGVRLVSEDPTSL